MVARIITSNCASIDASFAESTGSISSNDSWATYHQAPALLSSPDRVCQPMDQSLPRMPALGTALLEDRGVAPAFRRWVRGWAVIGLGGRPSYRGAGTGCADVRPR